MRSQAALSGRFLQTAAEFVRRRTGLVFAGARRSAFEAALARGLGRDVASSPETYLARLDEKPAVLDDLVAEITVGETYFLREPEQCAVIRARILPALLARRPPEFALRLWSAGCASGEEPYTLAIILRELGVAHAAHIVATDISRAALSRASRGLYGPWSLRGVPDHVVRSNFAVVGDRFALAPVVRDAVEFRYLNLAEDTYPSLPSGIWGMDLILCRNVLIYFDADTIARVAQRLMDCLSGDGWLLLGSSDPMLTDLVPCEVVITAAGLAYRRPGVASSGSHDLPPIARSEFSPAPEAAAQPVEVVFIAPAVAPAPTMVSDDLGEAEECYARRDYEGAAELAARLVSRDGAEPGQWIVLVRALANQGQLQAAGRACSAGLDRHRTTAELTYLHAVLLAEADLHADAASAARRALYLDPALVVAHLALGGALVRLGDLASASRSMRNAERLLSALPPTAIVPASDGESAARLAEMARVQLQLLQGRAA